MRRHLLAVVCLFALAACGGDATQPVPPPAPPPPGPPPPPPPPPAPVASVTVEPTAASLVPVQTAPLTATLRDAGGAVLTGRTVTWTSNTPAAATVNVSGIVTAVAPGTATITATSEGQSGTAQVTVHDGGFIGAAGGTMTAAGGQVQVQVPAGALTAGTALTVAALPSPPSHPMLVPGSAFSLGPDGTTFGQPVTVRLGWSADQVPDGASPEALRVHRHDGSGWVLLAGGSVDVVNRTAAGTTTSFSPFALIALPSHPAPVLAQLSPASALAGATGLTLTVSGTGFVEASRVHWNGVERLTTFVSATSLTAAIPASDLLAASTAQVTVVTPSPGGGTSAGLPFEVVTTPVLDAAITAGDRHTCDLTTGGEAFCWGWGPAAGAPLSSRNTPHPVEGGMKFAVLSPGGVHTCALSNGTAYCWGSNVNGRLGLGDLPPGTPTEFAVPTPVTGDLTFSDIQAGGNTTCALTPGGVAYCWGLGVELGTGSGAITRAPAPVAGGHTFSTLAVAVGTHTCALTAAGAAWCWGGGSAGRLGNGATANSNVPVPVSGDLQFSAIAAGGGHTCGLTVDGEAYCWGSGADGRLGNGSTANSSVPVAVAGGLNFVSITAGTAHTCALTSGGEAYCWGSGNAGRLGTGSTDDRTVPVPVSGGHAFASISAGSLHTCAVTTAGAGYCWGAGSFGRLGTGSSTTSQVPAAVLGGLVFTTVRAGGQHTCGLTTSGDAYCWGFSSEGSLGDGRTDNQYVRSPVPGGNLFTTLSAGGGHTCGIAITAALYCWGNNPWNQLGAPAPPVPQTPRHVLPGQTFIAASAGADHSCGVASDGKGFCWGRNNNAQLGDGTFTNRALPVEVAGGLSFSTIAAAGNHTCGLTSAGQAYCWGNGQGGRLGVDTPGSEVPIAVSGGHTFTMIGVSGMGGCGLTPVGATYCWGNGSPTPALVGGGHTFTTLAIGAAHSCGLLEGGTAYCWGLNELGQLGNTSVPVFTATPVVVMGGTSFMAIAAGGGHTCGIATNGDRYCWGWGLNGQLGNGLINNQPLPVLVAESAPFWQP